MDYSFDFWDASYSHHSHDSVHLFFEPDSPLEILPIRQNLPIEPQIDTVVGPLGNLNNHQVST